MTTLARSVTLCLMLAALAGCDLPPAAPAPKNTPEVQFVAGSVYDLRSIADPDTGCQYLLYSDRTMTSRIAADGKTHMGCKGAQP